MCSLRICAGICASFGSFIAVVLRAGRTGGRRIGRARLEGMSWRRAATGFVIGNVADFVVVGTVVADVVVGLLLAILLFSVVI